MTDLSTWLAKRGYPISNVTIGKPARTWRWTPQEHDKAIALRLDGYTYPQIARALHRTPNAVAARLRDYAGVDLA